MTRDCKPAPAPPADAVSNAAQRGGNAANPPQVPPDDVVPAFWRVKRLDEMTLDEWESLCDGCGLCCLVKLEDEDTGKVYTTDVACTLMDGDTCRCKDYEHRFERVPDCLKIDLAAVANLTWLPATCAYRAGTSTGGTTSSPAAPRPSTRPASPSATRPSARTTSTRRICRTGLRNGAGRGEMRCVWYDWAAANCQV